MELVHYTVCGDDCDVLFSDCEIKGIMVCNYTGEPKIEFGDFTYLKVKHIRS
jgi:hypothetical protein